MKTWNTPEVKELNINETANGFVDTDVEFWWVTNDSKSGTTDTNTDSTDSTDKLS